MSDIKIDLKVIFEKLKDKPYCIIKLSNDFPIYDKGSDLDIFCYDIEDVARIILGCLQSQNLSVKIIKKSQQLYIDIMEGGNINFRFDLYGSLPSYKNVMIKESFFSSVVENAIQFDGGGCLVKVPNEVNECILRYIEYHECYAHRPDKIKHIDYLLEKTEKSGVGLNVILDKLHYYIKLPMVKEDRLVTSNSFFRRASYLFKSFKKISIIFRAKGLKETVILIYKKIKK